MMSCRLKIQDPPIESPEKAIISKDFLSLFFWGGSCYVIREKSHAINEQTHLVFYKLVSKQVNMENMTKKTQESIGRVNPVEAKHTVTR